MRESKYARVLAGRPAADVIGRETAVERLLAHAHSASSDPLLVLAVPGAGASELLRQTYDRLFHEHETVIPFYFSLRKTVRSASSAAESFLNEFIRQLVAFRRREASIVHSVAGLDELAELSLSVSGIWIDRLIETARKASDGREFIRTCLAAPARAAAHEARTFVMFDGVQDLLDVDGGLDLLEELKDVMTNGGVPFVLSGHRRFLYGRAEGGRVEIDNLEFDDAGRVADIFARESGVKLREQSRDLIATQLNGSPSRMRTVIRTAQDTGLDLRSFDAVEKAYADAIFDGRLGRMFDGVVSGACGSAEVERRVLSILFEVRRSEKGIERELFTRRLQLTADESKNVLDRLNYAELVRLTPASVELADDNLAWMDHLDARRRLARAETRATVYGESLTAYIKRAPELMSRHYRASAAVGVREVLGAFDGRRVPSALLDYGSFREEVKGLPDAKVMDAVRVTPDARLPRIFFTTAASAFYKPIARIAETERAGVALGFEPSDDDPNEDIVWIAAEIDSKLEASRELTEFWCDRLEAAAVLCDFKRYRLWLISPEGFSQEALPVLAKRNAYGTSRRQIDLLRKFLGAPVPESQQLAPNEYEIVIPMHEDAELIAAHAVEEIAKRHSFDPRSINQIKTALVEACINATEHSLSPDRKIYQRFRVEEDRVVLTISNRGLRLASRSKTIEPDEGRRGWGLRLMRQLMDDVTIEQVDDGTRIVMTKFLKAA